MRCLIRPLLQALGCLGIGAGLGGCWLEIDEVVPEEPSGAGGSGGVAGTGTAGAQVLALPSDRPRALTLTQTHVYWVSDPSEPGAGNGAIYRVPKDADHAVPEVIASSQGEPFDIAAHPTDGSVYWTDRDKGQLWRVDESGTNVSLLQGGIAGAAGLVVDGTFVYVTNSLGSVIRVLLDGSAPQTLATTVPGAWRIGQFSNMVFWGGTDGTTLFRSNKNGESVTSLVTAAAGRRTFGIAANSAPEAGAFFWEGTDTTRQVRVYRYSDGAVSDVLDGFGENIVVAGTNAYAAIADNPGRIVTIRAQNYQVSDIALGQGEPWDLDVDFTHVYWANRSPPAIARTIR